LPITWQIPAIILLTLIFHKKVVFRAFSIYIFLGLFILPVFHQGGSLGYLLTPNFGYLLGLYPLIKIINNLNNRNKINVGNFLKNGYTVTALDASVKLLEVIETHKNLEKIESDFLNFKSKKSVHIKMILGLSLFLESD